MPHEGDIEEIRDALLAVRLRLECHLALNACWRALKTAELQSAVAEHLGSDPDQDNRRLHRKLLRHSRAYRAYTRVVEADRILNATPSAEPAAPAIDDGRHRPAHARAAQHGSDAAADCKPRIKVKAVSLAVPQS